MKYKCPLGRAQRNPTDVFNCWVSRCSTQPTVLVNLPKPERSAIMIENRRQDRVSALIQRELSEVIHRVVKDPRIAFCTVTYADVSSDLKYADVKVSVIGDLEQKEAALAGLKSAAGFLRREIGRRLTLRYSPELRFSLDDSVDHLMKIDGLLKEIDDEEEVSEDSTQDI